MRTNDMISEKMEPNLYKALTWSVWNKNVDATLIKERHEQRMWGKRLKLLTEQGEKLYSDGYVVSPLFEVELVLQPIHYSKKHCRDVDKLSKAPSDKGFAMPRFTGGLKQVCNM